MKLNKYKVGIYTHVYIDNYEDGEGDKVNYYSNESTHETSEPIEAIKKAMQNLGFTFDKKYAQSSDIYNCVYYSNLVDNDSFEILKSDTMYKEWKKGKINLFSANHSIFVHQLNELIIKL